MGSEELTAVAEQPVKTEALNGCKSNPANPADVIYFGGPSSPSTTKRSQSKMEKS
jgi:hypothetical protein